MAIWIGFHTLDENFHREVSARLHSGQTRAQALEELGYTARARTWLQNLPQGCRVIGDYIPQGIGGAHPAYAEFPSVTIIETDDPAHVTWLVNYFAGFANSAYHPYIQVAAT